VTDTPPPDEQRREHVRVGISHACTLTWGDASADDARLLDLSGRGCAVMSTRERQLGDEGRISIPFEEWTFDGPVVVRSARDREDAWALGLNFPEAGSHDIDRLVREVFVELRNQLRKSS